MFARAIYKGHTIPYHSWFSPFTVVHNKPLVVCYIQGLSHLDSDTGVWYGLRLSTLI